MAGHEILIELDDFPKGDFSPLPGQFLEARH